MAAEVKIKENLNPKIRPNLMDMNEEMRKIVHPFYERPYVPQEVDKLAEQTHNIRRSLTKHLTKVQYVGTVDNKKGLNEKPTMWSTVITNRPTSISYPVPKLNTSIISPEGNAFLDASELSGESTSNDEPLAHKLEGKYSIPVVIKQNTLSDPMEGRNYENPLFIHKSEKIKEEGIDHRVHERRPLNQQMNSQIHEELEIVRNRLRTARSDDDKINALLEGEKRLNAQIGEIKKRIHHAVGGIVQAKNTGILMDNILNHYDKYISSREFEKLKLVDLVEVKNQLKVKLMRELQGLRSSTNEFKVLRKVNQEDIQHVIEEIKGELGY